MNRTKKENCNTKLQSIRVARKMCQRELAEKSGVKYRVVQDYEQGRTNFSNSKFLTIVSLCQALDCGIEDIIDDKNAIKYLKEHYERKK